MCEMEQVRSGQTNTFTMEHSSATKSATPSMVCDKQLLVQTTLHTYIHRHTSCIYSKTAPVLFVSMRANAVCLRYDGLVTCLGFVCWRCWRFYSSKKFAGLQIYPLSSNFKAMDGSLDAVNMVITKRRDCKIKRHLEGSNCITVSLPICLSTVSNTSIKTIFAFIHTGGFSYTRKSTRTKTPPS